MKNEDIVAESIEKLVDEIFEDIADIFYREKLSRHEIKMVLVLLEEIIMKELLKPQIKQINR
jgi:hypothetical protein